MLSFKLVYMHKARFHRSFTAFNTLAWQGIDEEQDGQSFIRVESKSAMVRVSLDRSE